ncbi:MAG: MaoC/PaaZ C-terminal domain-containing protein [Acidimicrobiales bacterium]|nr:MaoC/PaaZ C-terminal domain-containing protein [Acidimicrobiales bacterium]
MASTPDASHSNMERYFDDLVLGEKFESRWFSADEIEMIEFARQFDPQYFHIDPDKAKSSPFGQIVASGTYTFAIWNKLNLEVNGDIAWIAGLGFNDFKFPNPFLPGTPIQSTSHLISKRESKKNLQRGLVIHEYTVKDKEGGIIFECTCPALVARVTE